MKIGRETEKFISYESPQAGEAGTKQGFLSHLLLKVNSGRGILVHLSFIMVHLGSKFLK